LQWKRTTGRPRRRWKPNIKEVLREVGCELGGTGSGWCPVAGCGISDVEPSDSATRVS
jgi:hypothetical protein